MIDLTTIGALLNLPGFRDDLKGPRTRGSTTERGLDALDPDTNVSEFTPQAGAVSVARYFRVEAPQLGGRLGAVSLKSLPADLLPLLRARDTENHGRELFLDRDESTADLPGAPFLTVILGPIPVRDDDGEPVTGDDGEPVTTLGWWTWFPGEPTGATPAEGSQPDDPQNLVSVKLHNG